MKVYNVKVYDLDQFGTKYGIMGDKMPVDNIMITKGLFGAKEIITHQPIKIFSNASILSRIDLEYYRKYGFVLGANELSLAYKNMAFKNDLDEYAESFLESDFIKYLRKYDSDSLNQSNIDYRIEKIKRKM